MICLLLNTTQVSPVAPTKNSLQHHRFTRPRPTVCTPGNQVFLTLDQGDPCQVLQYSRNYLSCHRGEQTL